MSESRIFSSGLYNEVAVKSEGVNAVFTQIFEDEYEVVLEISSQKFLIRFSDYCGSIEKFEILSIKGFVYNLTNSLILALRTIVQSLMPSN